MICHSLFIRTKKGVQTHSDDMTKPEPILYPPPNNSKFSLKLLPWHQHEYSDSRFHEYNQSYLTQDLENECPLIASCF